MNLPFKTTGALLVMVSILFLSVHSAYADETYVVQPGDSIYKISQMYGITMQSIVEANNLPNANLIIVGQELIIPADGVRVVTTTSNPTTAVSAADSLANKVVEDGTYVVQPGDSVYKIATQHGLFVSELIEANNLTNPNVIIVGQTLIIPGGGVVSPPPATTTPATTTPTTTTPTTTAAPTATNNYFPNPSFEADWYYHLYNELQIPDGWQVAVNEGVNDLPDGSGGLFFRPEIRVVPSYDLPDHEVSTFIFDGQKTIKAFKGGAPTSFELFTEVTLPAGTYRFTSQFFADTVIEYQNGQKVWDTRPLAAEVRMIHNDGGTAWQQVSTGQKGVLTYQFTISSTITVRLGTAFRNRYVNNNNGWFIDDWKLEKISN